MSEDLFSTRRLRPGHRVPCYRGWVPVVSGYLSFSVVGDANHPTKAINVNVADQSNRFVICYQKRPALDAPFPRLSLLVSRLFPRARDDHWHASRREPNLWFLCLASCDKTADHRALEGWVYVFPRDVWRDKIEVRVRAGQEQLKKLENKSNGTLSAEMERPFAGLLNYCAEHAAANGEFLLERNGAFSLTMLEPTQPEPHHVGIGFMGIGKQSQTNRVVALNDRTLGEVVSQCYYFVRDLAHTHQHHNAGSDQLTTLHYDDGGPDSSRWVRHSYYHLMRMVISLKRKREYGEMEAAIGVLSYARTLHAIALETIGSNLKTKLRFRQRSYGKDNLAKSIEARIAGEREARKARHDGLSRRISLTALCLSLLAVNMTILNIGKPDKYDFHIAPVYLAVESFAAQNPFLFNGAVLAAIILWVKGAKHLAKRTDFERNILHFLFTWKPKNAAAIAVLLGIVIMGFFTWVALWLVPYWLE